MIYAPIDIVFFIIVLYFLISAAIRGLIKEFFSKAAFIIGIISAVIFAPRLEVFVRDGLKNQLLSKVVSFLLIFIIVFLFVKIIQEIISNVFSGEILSGLDRALGIVFGIVEGLAIVSLLIIIINIQPVFNAQKLLENSFFYRLLEGVIKSSERTLQELPK